MASTAAFRVKADVVPGKNNNLVPARTARRLDIECTVMCGVNHSYMLSKVHVIPEGTFLRGTSANPTCLCCRQTRRGGCLIRPVGNAS